MNTISYIAEDVIYRDLEDVIIIKNLRYREIMTLENVSADIWRFLCRKTEVNFHDIVSNISEIYEVPFEEIIDDIKNFLEDLYTSRIIKINGECYKSSNKLKMESSYYKEIEKQIIQLYRQKGLMYSITFELTYSCNEKCIHCYANYPDNSYKSRRLSLSSLKKIISELYDMKCMHITFTGGDPFMFPDFIELYEFARHSGFSCDIFTNGLYLYDHSEAFDRITSLNPQVFFISLYGADSVTHDSVTTIQGSFDKTVTVIKKIKSINIPVVINVMVLKNNADKIKDIISFIKWLGVDYRIGMSLIYKNDGSDSPMKHFINNKNIIKEIIMLEYEHVFSFDQQITNDEDTFFCGAAQTSLSVSPDGNIYPCVSLKNQLGNIFDESISKVWYSKERLNLLSIFSKENASKCSACKYSDKCPHCIGISQAETGDMFSCNTCDRLIAECLYELYN